MVAIHPTGDHLIIHDVKVREIGAEDLRIALYQGWDDFKDKRGDILFLGVIYPLVGVIASLAAFDQNLLPIVFPLAAGLTLLGPAVASGFYELARRREQGEDTSWRHFTDVMRSHSITSIIALALVLLVCFALWVAAAWAIYAATLGPEPPASLASFLSQLFTTEEGWTLIIVGNLVGLLFAALVLTISVVSFPMLVDRPVSAITAVETSVRAVRRNPGTMALWGLIVAVLLVIGSVPLFVGLAVVLPVLGYATWHLYTRVVER